MKPFISPSSKNKRSFIKINITPMTKQDLLSLCHYYRGEVKCPFDSETERPQGLFWMFEELFVRHSLNDPTFFEGYKEMVARYIENHPGISNDLTNDRFPIGTKAIIMYSEDMLQKWVPYEVDLIFQYGNV